MKLGGSDGERGGLWIVVLDGEAQQFAPPDPGGRQQDERDPKERAPEGAPRHRAQGAGRRQQAEDLRVGKQMGPDGLVGMGKAGRIRDEALRGGAAVVQAEVPHDPHPTAADPGGHVGLGVAPGGKDAGGERRGAGARHHRGERLEHAPFIGEPAAQRLLQIEVPAQHRGQPGLGCGRHQAPSWAPPAGSGRATSRRASRSSRR